jgi:hypothetical protein
MDAAPASPETNADGIPAPTADAHPETGDALIDVALRDLAAAPDGDLDAGLIAGEYVQRTLQARLGDLGG